jgi:hypothetical protein
MAARLRWGGAVKVHRSGRLRLTVLVFGASLLVACGQARPPALLGAATQSPKPALPAPVSAAGRGPIASSPAQTAATQSTSLAASVAGSAEPDGPVLVADGFSSSNVGGSYAVVVENPRSTAAAVRGNVRLLTASGQVSSEHTFLIPYVGPRSRSGWADALPAVAGDEPVRMEVALHSAPPGEVGGDAIVVEVVGVTAGAAPLATVLLTNHNAEPVVQARLSIIAYTDEGAVAGGAARATPALTPHLDTQLVVPLPGVPKPARVEGYIALTPATPD